jgi:regulator of protease activity HflC (stomatin/prohibitin superfamily)
MEDRMKDQDSSSEIYEESSPRRRGIVLIVIIGILVAAAAVGYIAFLTYIPPNEYGIKQVMIGFNRGIQKKVYEAGYHLLLPQPFQRMHRLPKDIQVLELSDNPLTAAKFARHEKAAYIQTSDGFFVEVDASILYRITDPYQVITTLGPGQQFKDSGIVPRAVPILKQTLGELTTEEFYNSPLRVEKAQMAENLLNKELEPKGIKVEHVLIRYFQYSEEIQKNIEEKKLKDQLVFKNQAEARAAAEQAKLKRAVEEGKAAVRVKLQEGKAYQVRRDAEAELYTRRRRAEGELKVREAQAAKIKLKNEALQTQGADRYVGLEMVDIYKGLQVIILPSDGDKGLNPLNMTDNFKMFDIKTGQE